MFKRVLITGGCGFIGSNLTKNLVKKGWKIDVIDDMPNGHLELLEAGIFLLKFQKFLILSF